MRALLVCLALSFAVAPFQCASDPDPDREIEDSAPEALWDLSEEFRQTGDDEARRRTLQRIVDRYPSSRFAVRAEQALAE